MTLIPFPYCEEGKLMPETECPCHICKLIRSIIAMTNQMKSAQETGAPGKPPYPVIESMTVLHTASGLRARVWRNESEVKALYPNSDLYSESFRAMKEPHCLAEALAAMPRVNAVEVMRQGQDQGIILYTNWP